ncbi:hypothetical protein Q2K19_31395 [Micromonospora soli]|uniref:hypothetical protein n=1 Tax=Micromonospora sp. NBRC 110009 TaxID=3061627 RepID=UPI0026736730|nr:hypothetical protein [Micromonospora sp. NBRC 110009]WKT98599.1 hypothetical protein Q2K19_31395 [Micromonospora sp. NBRC 110009]
MDCTKLEWNPLSSASPHSQLAGVLAGLVFAGIVVLLSDRNPSRQKTRALVLFTGALLALALDSFIFGVIAGEQVCAKAWSETMPAAGLLGLGAVGIFGGISWLFNAHDDQNAHVTRLANFITYVVALVVAYHLQVTAGSYLVDMRAFGLNSPPSWLVRVVDLYAWLIVLIILLFPLFRRLTEKASLRRTPGDTTKEADDRRLDSWAIRAAYLSVGWVIIVAAMSGILLSRTIDGWEPTTPTTIVASSTLASLTIPTIALRDVS